MLEKVVVVVRALAGRLRLKWIGRPLIVKDTAA